MAPPSGKGFSESELELFARSADEAQWRRKERQVVDAAHRKTVERDEIRQEFSAYKDSVQDHIAAAVREATRDAADKLAAAQAMRARDLLRIKELEGLASKNSTQASPADADEFVVRKIEEAKTLRAKISELVSQKKELDDKHVALEVKYSELESEQRDLQASVSVIMEARDTAIAEKQCVAKELGDLQKATSPVTGTGSLADFPLLHRTGKERCPSVTDSALSSSVTSSAYSQLSDRLESLEKLVKERLPQDEKHAVADPKPAEKVSPETEDGPTPNRNPPNPWQVQGKDKKKKK